MENNFTPCEQRPDPESLLVELDCDSGRARTPRTIRNKKFMFFFNRCYDLFGSQNDHQAWLVEEYPDGKYRNYWMVKRTGTDEIYTLYCCYYEWRIGGNDKGTHLGELMELLNPDLYTGLSSKTTDEIIKKYRFKREAQYKQ